MLKSKRLVSLVISIIIFAMLMVIPNKCNAVEPSTPVYFGVSLIRENSATSIKGINGTDAGKNIGYAIGDPKANQSADSLRYGAIIWNIMKYSSDTVGTTGDEGNYYCIREGAGFRGANINNDTIKKYTSSYEMKENNKSTITSSISLLKDISDENYKGLLALTDLLYLGETDDEEGRREFLEPILKTQGKSVQNYNVMLTYADVKAVQQAAIWYFSNKDGQEISNQWETLLDNTEKDNWLSYTIDGNNYSSLSNYDLGFSQTGIQRGSGKERKEQANILYRYLVSEAIKKVSTGIINSNKKVTVYTDLADSDNTQPIIYIEKIPEIKEFDLALRKYITKVDEVSLTHENSRVPDIDEGTLEDEKTATYKHRKNPVIVKTGSVVTYNLTVYNEGEKAGRVQIIEDQLPEGLQFSKINTNGFTASVDSGTNKLTITREENNTKNLEAYTKNNLQSEIIEIECIVTAKPDSSNKKVLTNVAWIKEEFDAVDNVTITSDVGKDIDSTPYMIPNVNKDSMSNYIGNGDNKIDLTDSGYYYKGQEDDDDFEKLVLEPVKPLEFDLALRKYITKVDGVSLTHENSRVPDIDESTLENEKTATYKHRKNSVTVKTGSIVTYNLTIYNEGEKAGRAQIIEDQLPEGLQFSKINTNGFTANVDSNTNRLTITREENNTKNLEAYTKNNLQSETIEIECIVTAKPDSSDTKILTNVAWIEEEFDAVDNITITSEIGKDRDSTPYIIPNVNKDSISDYIGNGDNKIDLTDSDYYYKGQEDDDDFEKLVLEPVKPLEFDLALRKYITKVDGVPITGENSRVPDIDESTLENEKTATYKHRKNPVTVKTRSIVTYNLTIYNEGEKAGRAQIIKDQLPEGLQFSKINTNGFTANVDSGTNRLTITREENNTKNLEAYAKNNLKSETIEIECIVTAKPDSSNNKILTNVAWIEEEFDAVDNITITSEIGKDRDSTPYIIPNVNKDSISDYIGNENNKTDLTDSDYYYKGQEDDDDFEKLVLESAEFDLKLVKRIVEVNATKVPERIEDVDITNLANGTETTAKYILNTTPVLVKKGDIVKYTFRVYNEGDIDGYASEITEDIPEGLEFVWSEKTDDAELNADKTLSEQEREAIKYNQSIWDIKSINKDTKKIELISTDYLAKGKGAEIKNNGANLIKAFNPLNEYKNTINEKNPDYKEVSVYLKVTSENETKVIIRNEAAITDDTDSEGDPIDDRDSSTDKWIKYEDDEDYDNIILQSFDLSLRKFIIAVSKDTKIEDSEYLKKSDGTYKRAPIVDTSKLNTIDENGKIITTAIYNHTKEPIEVSKGDIVVYMLRVYNECEIDGYASEITDYLPSYLEYVDSDFNKQYGWSVSGDDGRTVKTAYLDNHKISSIETNSEGKIILSYKEVPIMCRVTDNAEGKITNIAEITVSKDENKKIINDRDSNINNLVKPEDKDLPSYNDDKTDSYIPGQEDDDDFEKVVVKKFDLALRKFITNVSDNDVTSRIPQVKYDKEKGKIIYEHTKEPVDVVTGDTVVYTLRVYNEGEIDGYASEISDDIPEGLQYLPQNDLNKEFRWVMYDKDGNKTEDSSKAVKIVTDYLSKEQGEARMKDDTEIKENPALLTAFDKDKEISDKNPDYADVKVAFKVIESNKSDRVIVNYAQISEDTDKNGNPVDDIDSTPDKWIDGEDDQDNEFIKLSYFDLALRKWVTDAIVIENGEEYVTKTGHTPEQDPEPVVKVELNRKNLNTVTVKFKYSIRITNEGDIAGYAKEITDYVPEGLKFVLDDNPGWKDEGNNVISTRLLENKLLQPGEFADVEVILTWINGNNNLGLKVNVAEISEDYNDRHAPDVDSTPDNKVEGEDDIDDAPVMLSIATGGAKVYFSLSVLILVSVAGGIALIRKFVL